MMTWLSKQSKDVLSESPIWIGIIDYNACQTITNSFSQEMLKCYIDPNELKAISANSNMACEDVFDRLLPTKAKLKSGDFGEIFSRSVLQERMVDSSFPSYRWRHREYENDTVRGVDLIGFVIKGTIDSNEDTLIWCEVKTRSRTVDQYVVERAYTDVVKHYVSKQASTLFFLQQKLLMQGDPDAAKTIGRFNNPHRIPYQRLLVPCVVHENDTWRDDFLTHLPTIFQASEQYKIHEEIELYVFRVENLSTWLDDVHLSAKDYASTL